MNPLVHYLDAASVATYGWLLPNPSGAAADYLGVQFQVLVLLEDAPNVEIPAYLAGGEVILLDEPVEDPAVMAIDLGPGSLDLEPGTYRAVRRLDDGSGWRAIPASEFYLKLRRIDP